MGRRRLLMGSEENIEMTKELDDWLKRSQSVWRLGVVTRGILYIW